MTKIIFLLLLTFTMGEVKISQLTDPVFPDRNPNKCVFTNNKRLFKAYKSQLMIITLKCNKVKNVYLYINKQKIDLKGVIKNSNSTVDVNITNYLKDGVNTIELNVMPRGAFVIVNVPYPVLTRGTPESVGISPELLKKVDELITNDVKKGFPGATLIVVKNGKIVKETAYGYARKYTDKGKLMDKFQEMKVDTMFDMASNTKMFSSIFSLMNLCYKKKLDYTLAVQNYIKEYKGNGRESITVFDVLTHIAGYQSTYQFYTKNVTCHSRSKKDTEKCICNKVNFVRKKGGNPVYSDVDYIIAGLLVEHISGEELQNYTKNHIYKPLGLKRTTYSPLLNGFSKEDAAATEIFGNTRNFSINFTGVRTKVIQGEVHDEVSFYSMNETSGHAGLFSTVGDMAILGQVLLNRGGYGDVKLWTQDIQDLFVKPYNLNPTYGIGWIRQANEGVTWHFGTYASNEAIGHTGWTGTATVIDPKHDLAIILLTNKKHSPFIKNFFIGDIFETGKYGSVMQLIYESFLNV